MTIIPDWMKPWTDSITTGVTVGAILDWLPYVAAFFAILYWLVRLYETPTVQWIIMSWLQRRRERNREGE